MSVNQVLVTEFLKIAIEELNNDEIEPTPRAQYSLLCSWCEMYDDVPPRNHVEVRVRDALEEARDVAHARCTPQFLLTQG